MGRNSRPLPAVLLALLCATSGSAALAEDLFATDACSLSAPERRTVAEVKDGETLQLSDGTIVRLIGAKAPAAPLGYRGERPWPFVDEAKQALVQATQSAEVELRYGGTRTDRHGRLLAHVFAVKGDERVWLQEALVSEGLARVYSFPDNRACVGMLLASEAEARAKKKGLWGSSAYRILAAGDLERLSRLSRSYQLVEGMVVATGEGRTRLYLNFAEDWRRDFTVWGKRKDAETLRAEGLDLKALAGKRVRVRGWVEWWNGPMIEVTHSGQIEVLPGEGGASAPEEKQHAGTAL